MSFSQRAPRTYGSPKYVAAKAISQLSGLKTASHLLRRPLSTVSAWTLPSVPNEIPYGAVQLATASGAHAFVNDLCAIAGGAFIPAQEPDADPDRLVASAAEHFGRLISRYMAGSANNNDLRHELDEAISAMAAMRARLSGPK